LAEQSLPNLKKLAIARFCEFGSQIVYKLTHSAIGLFQELSPTMLQSECMKYISSNIHNNIYNIAMFTLFYARLVIFANDLVVDTSEGDLLQIFITRMFLLNSNILQYFSYWHMVAIYFYNNQTYLPAFAGLNTIQITQKYLIINDWWCIMEIFFEDSLPSPFERPLDLLLVECWVLQNVHCRKSQSTEYPTILAMKNCAKPLINILSNKIIISPYLLYTLEYLTNKENALYAAFR